MVPMPATASPKVSSSTVTPVILVRSEMPFHHRSNDACSFAISCSASAAPAAGASRLRGLEHVAEAALGLDHRLGQVLVDLAAQVGDVALDDARVAVEVVLPHVVEDLRLRQHPVGVEHEVTQQLELGGGELDGHISHGHLAGVLIHRELAGADDGVFFVLHPAAQDRLDARDDLVEREGLGDVVVAADGETGDLVFRVVFRGEEQDGRRVAGCPQALGDAEAVHIGQHDVEDDEVGLLIEHRRDGLCAVADRAHGETGESQARGERVGDIGLVIDEADLGSVAHSAIICMFAVCALDRYRIASCARVIRTQHPSSSGVTASTISGSAPAPSAMPRSRAAFAWQTSSVCAEASRWNGQLASAMPPASSARGWYPPSWGAASSDPACAPSRRPVAVATLASASRTGRWDRSASSIAEASSSLASSYWRGGIDTCTSPGARRYSLAGRPDPGPVRPLSRRYSVTSSPCSTSRSRWNATVLRESPRCSAASSRPTGSLCRLTKS